MKPAFNDRMIMKFVIFVKLMQDFLILYDECPQMLLQLFVDQTLVW